LLAWYGIAVSEEAFFAGLPASDNPEYGFVGSVDDPGEGLPPSGYGVYEEPVAARLRAHGLPVETHRGRDLAWLRDRVASGHPVLVWVTSRLAVPVPVTLRDRQGRSFVAVRGEHTVLVTGYERGGLYLLDPALGETRRASDAQVRAAWGGLGRRAIVRAECPGS
jgi:uncharacterized protein YvpB